MRRFNFYLSLLLLLVFAASCNDDFDTPPIVVPQAKDAPNMTIAELKDKYWKDPVNYIDTVKENAIIHGYVTSSDATGNIYKNLVIQDATGALSISINSSSLYTDYRVGQEIVIPLKNLFIGKYNSLLQLGYPEWYASGQVWEASFMPLAMFQAAAELNGMPNLSAIDTTVVKISDLKTDAAGLKKWQSRLVRFDDVKFVDADGVKTYSDPNASTNRSIEDASGSTIVVRNSNYATFKNTPLPVGKGSVVGILSYYGTRAGSGTWQVLIRSTNDCLFNGDTHGTFVNPYTMDDVVAKQNTGTSGWMTGYIVGAVAPEVTTVKSSSDIEWKAPTTLDNTLVIGPSADCKDIAKCAIVALPQGTPFRQQANLKDFPELYKTQIWVKGTFATFMGANGITNNSGSKDEYKLSIATGGVTTLNEGFDGGIPSEWTNVQVKGDKDWFKTAFSGNAYAAMTGYKGTAPFDSWLITPALKIKDAASKILSFKSEVNGYGSSTSHFEVYLMSSADPTTATLIKLNPTLPEAPASGYSGWTESGDIDLSSYAGTYYIGFRYSAESDANYATWCIDDVKFNSNGGGGGGTVTSATRGDFETFNGGAPTGYYGTYTTTNGWTAANCSLLQGGSADSNPVFQFIGFKTGSTTEYAMAANLNGKTTSIGTLISPTISGGLGTLKFNYGYAYTETSGVSFRVDIKQNGSVVKTFTVTKADAVKYTSYEFSEDVNITGQFNIEFTNLAPSQSTSNKDRVAIWNVNWTAKN